MPRKFLIFPILFILFTAGIFPYSYASPESEAEEDMYAGCRSEQTLVYRFAYLDHVCVEPSTAKRWVELGFAEIKLNSTSSTMNESNPGTTYEEKYPGAPPPAPTKSPSDTDSQCRDGQVLVYRFSYQDDFCINQSTAITWERYGMVEILDTQKPSEIIVDSAPIIVEPIKELIVEDTPKPIKELIVEDTPKPIKELIVEDTPKPNNTISEFDLIEHSDFPKIYLIDDEVWAIVDHDKSSSVIMEGETGLVMIDSLTSYSSMKKVMDYFKEMSDKHVKIIIFTSVSSESVFASSAIVGKGVDEVEMILSDELLYLYNQDNDLKIKNVITYPPREIFSIHVGGVDLDLISFDRYNTEQTYISLPISDGMLMGDSKSGIFPVVLDMKHVQIFNEELSDKSKTKE